MTHPPVVVTAPGVLFDAQTVVLLLRWLPSPERLRADAADPGFVAVVERLQVAGRLAAAAGSAAGSAEPGHAVASVPQAVASSLSRRGLTASQAAAVAGVGVRAMTKRAVAMQRRGEAWRVGREWRFDEAAVRRGIGGGSAMTVRADSDWQVV